MKEIKDIKRILDSKNISYYDWDNEQGITIRICELGDNYYDYGKNPPKRIRIDDKKVRNLDLENNPHIHLLYCEDCFGCGSW